MSDSERTPGSGALTMREVAQRLGVSPMTVSRALRGDAGVGEPTRTRVLDAVRALGYRRNDLARRLRSGRDHELIGLVVTNLANPFYSQLAVGMEQVAAEHGARVLLGSTHENLELERDLVEDMADRQVDGLVVVPIGDDHSHLSPSQLSGVTVVLAAAPPVGIEADCVLVDDFGGTREASRQLIERGHRRIGFLGLPPAKWTGSERFRGYAAAHDAAGIDLDPTLVNQHGGDITAAEKAAQSLLERPDPPTALVTANNRNTIGALRAIRSAERAVALAGFDDIELADLLQLPLSVVAYDPAEVGRAAARLVFERAEQDLRPSAGRTPARRVTIPTRIVDYPRRA